LSTEQQPNDIVNVAAFRRLRRSVIVPFTLHYELNPVTACDQDPTTLNSLISMMTEILLTAYFFYPYHNA